MKPRGGPRIAPVLHCDDSFGLEPWGAQGKPFEARVIPYRLSGWVRSVTRVHL